MCERMMLRSLTSVRMCSTLWLRAPRPPAPPPRRLSVRMLRTLRWLVSGVTGGWLLPRMRGRLRWRLARLARFSSSTRSMWRR